MAQWKEVQGYKGKYLVSDEGEIYSLPRKVNNGRGDFVLNGKILKSGLRGRGGLKYKFVVLSDGNVAKSLSVHRLVAEAFVDNPHDLEFVNHIDKNTLNNSAENLEWCTQQYNNEYSHNKKVSQFQDGLKIAEYKSITVASQITKISRTAIGNALAGWSRTAGGYEWKYEEE